MTSLRSKGQLQHQPHLRSTGRTAKEVEGLGLPVASGRTGPGGIAPELDEPRLVGMQLQVELRETLSKVGEELLGVGLVLEPGHKVISKPHDDHVTVGVPPPPLPDPPVEDVMKVDVRRPAGRSCPPAWRCRAAAAARPPSRCTPSETDSPGTSRSRPFGAGLGVSPPSRPRRPPTSPCPHPAQPGGESPSRPPGGGSGRRGAAKR